MTKNIASLVTSAGILLFIDGTQYTVGNDHPNFTKIKEAVKAKRFDAIPALADIVTSVRNWINNGKDFELRGDQVYLNGDPFSAEITSKVLSMIEAGNDAEPLYAFLRKVRLNPSMAAQNELLLFCVANGFMIHEDGDIIAYKSVRGNYMDIHSGKFRNAVGDVVKMVRHAVDDDRNRTCSSGLHFASHEYASTWAGAIDGVSRRLMVMKINPANVVAIPADYANQKGRCSEYTVLSEMTGGNRLPKREVYDNASVGARPLTQRERDVAQFGETVVAQRERSAELSAAAAAFKRDQTISKINAEITRKRNVILNYENELIELNDAMEQIEELGGMTSDEQDERRDQLEEYIEKIEGEVRVLQNKLLSV